MGEVADLAERAWSGDVGEINVHPGHVLVGLEEYDAGLAFMSAFSNIAVIETPKGLVFIDASGPFHAGQVHDAIRAWSDAPLHTAVFTHGHVDHVFGLGPFEAEGRGAVRVIAHEACPSRFDRYALTHGYNGHINSRQFGFPKPVFPKDFRYPDETMGDARTLDVGGVRIELYHDKGETDDHLWAWLPDLGTLYTGDLFIWAAPNCGNPQKVQRYPREWAQALRKMQRLGAERLFPGHGPPIIGAERVSRALSESAELLETLVEQTLALMNDGARLNDILHSIELPTHLLTRPYLRPIYDDPMFIVRNLWRLYGGWWDGDASSLKPARDADLARAVAELSGGARPIAEHAQVLADRGELAVACHLAEFAWRAAPDDAAVSTIRTEIYRMRIQAESSLMAKGIFGAAARDSDPVST